MKLPSESAFSTYHEALFTLTRPVRWSITLSVTRMYPYGARWHGTFPAGIYKTTDGGESWREHNVGWTNDGVFSLAFHPRDTNIIYAGTYNGMNRSMDGGERWEMWDNG